MTREEELANIEAFVRERRVTRLPPTSALELDAAVIARLLSYRETIERHWREARERGWRRRWRR